jgi:hypothetical protein
MVNSEHLANPVSQSLTVASGAVAMDPIIPSYSWGSDEETEPSLKPKKHKQKAAILEDQEWKHQEYWKTVYS